MAPAIQQYLADLPDLVTPEILATKLGIKTKTLYQRIWRQKKNPNLNILPPLLVIPGCNRVAFARQSCIDWWCESAQPQIRVVVEVALVKKSAGRPTKAQQLAARR